MIAILAFIGAILFTWEALVVLFVLGIICEYNEWRGFAIFIAIVSAICAYFFFSVPLVTVAEYSAGYLVIGFIWSFWRYKRHVDKVVDEIKENGRRSGDTTRLEYLKPTRMVGTIVAWVIVWPFSFVENFTQDIIRGIELVIKKVLHKVYNAIYASAIKSLDVEEKKE